MVCFLPTLSVSCTLGLIQLLRFFWTQILEAVERSGPFLSVFKGLRGLCPGKARVPVVSVGGYAGWELLQEAQSLWINTFSSGDGPPRDRVQGSDAVGCWCSTEFWAPH